MPNLLFGVLCLPGDQSHPFAQPTINPLARSICWACLLGRAVFPPWNEGPNFGSYISIIYVLRYTHTTFINTHIYFYQIQFMIVLIYGQFYIELVWYNKRKNKKTECWVSKQPIVIGDSLPFTNCKLKRKKKVLFFFFNFSFSLSLSSTSFPSSPPSLPYFSPFLNFYSWEWPWSESILSSCETASPQIQM